MFRFVNKLKNKKGFTLVELIIVLAVLGIIAAIAVPRFTKVKEDAKRDADIATASTLAKATELAMANDEIGFSDTVDIDDDLVKNGYLDVEPKPQNGKKFVVVTDSKGLIKVYCDSTSGTALYPNQE